jgi:serine/threonine protein kinase/tetratricopeptide (TPR) repeat protein
MQGLVAGLTLAERFTLIRQLGTGGMGEIWLADDQQLHEQVALKLLNSPEHQSDTFVDLLRQECSKARGLVHPNIVRIYDFHSSAIGSDALFFISMQYVDGETLVASRAAAFQLITAQVLMVCDALEYAHRAGIIHRDIKASNVLCDRNGVCYLTDFGIATALADDHRLADLRGGGSLPAMSPQQVAGLQATVADDIYSLGALLYELLSGEPLFHPDVTKDRIRTETPAVLSLDGTQQTIPQPLVLLVQAMLDKSPERRPAGVGAVRAVLEELRADYPVKQRPPPSAESTDGDDLIRPVARRARIDSKPTEKSRSVASRRPQSDAKKHSARWVYGGFGALLLIALGVIFFLPSIVQERGPVVVVPAERAPAEMPSGPAGPDPGESLAQREIADEVLGDLLVIDDRLRAAGVDLWGGTDWSDVRALTELGDESYRARDYAGALDSYRQALTDMELIELRIPEMLATYLRQGAAAFEAGKQEAAISNFEIAIAIDGDNTEARKGLRRAMRLDRVLVLMSQAIELEQSGQPEQARSLYKEALTLDPAWQEAQEGFARTGNLLARTAYETQMAAGYSALAAEDFVRARTGFRAALNTRPGDADASTALRQVDAEERLRKIIDIQKQAMAAEQDENWTLAASEYEAILNVDSTVASAQQNLLRSRGRIELHEQLENEISHADRFNDDQVAQAASRLLERARSAGQPGPVLLSQIARLTVLLRVAAIPIPVEFRSDELTEVVIYKVGRLGAFLTKTLELKPGSYVAVGSRQGYRDVRRDFLIAADGSKQSIVLICEEPI